MDGNEAISGEMSQAAAAAKKRTRASIACNHCRAKRSKCDAATVGTPCSQCSKDNHRCELPQDGKRQRPSSRIQVEALTERVEMLEGLLKMSKGSSVPVSPNPPPSLSNRPSDRHIPLGDSCSSVSIGLAHQSSEDSEPDISFADNILFGLEEGNTLDNFDPGGSASDAIFAWGLESISKSTPVPSATTVPPRADLPTTKETERLVSHDSEPLKRRKLSLANGRPEILCVDLPSSASPGSPPSSSIPESLVDHLLDMYFQHFQTLLKIVDEPTFRASMSSSQSVPACRESLLLAMLAAGARFSSDAAMIKQYSNRSGESVFLRRAKALLESEVGQADIMTVQALLILGELETSAGNEMSGCMYSGLVSRLVFDLRLDPASQQELNLSDSDISVRHWILWYASVQDKYWAQSMERPLTIKNMELQLSRMIAKFAQQSSAERLPSLEDIIQESIMDLMELARDALDFLVGSFNFKVSVESYATMSRIISKLDHWFRNLPQFVRDDPTSSSNNKHFVFVLHMQLHLTKIQLYQPFAFHQPQHAPHDSAAIRLTESRIADDCQTLGTSSAIKIAKLFATFRRRHDIRYLQCSGTQYASIAARFLIKHIPLLQPDEVVEPEAHLRSLTRTLEDMSRTFKPALKPLEEALDVLQSLEGRANMERSTPYTEPSYLNRSYSSSCARPALDNLELTPDILLPANGEPDLRPVNGSAERIIHRQSR